MERALEFTERRIGQLQASITFKSTALGDLKAKRTELAASAQKQDAIIKRLTATRENLEQQARAVQDEVAVRCWRETGR